MNKNLEIKINNPDGSISKMWMDYDQYLEFQKPNYMAKTKHPTINETPLDNRIIVLEDKAPSVSKGGILLPAESAEKPYTGVILAVGPNCEKLKLYDQVRYAKRAGDKIEIDQEEYLMLRETDCYTILNK